MPEGESTVKKENAHITEASVKEETAKDAKEEM